jgi:hypothetical protein
MPQVKTVVGAAGAEAALGMVLAVSVGVYWRWQVKALPDLRLALFDALSALRTEALGEFRKGARHLAKVRCE